MRRLPLLACALLLAIATAGCGSADGGGAGGDAGAAGGDGAGGNGREEVAARVVRVVDGDTLIARIGGDDARVRMVGVDAPESVTPDRPVECFGPQAGDAARRLMPEGAPLTLAFDPSQGREDRFGRLLAEVTRAGESTTVNEQLIAGGFAEVFRGDGRGRLGPRLRAAERDARAARRGLWGACRE